MGIFDELAGAKDYNKIYLLVTYMRQSVKKNNTL